MAEKTPREKIREQLEALKAKRLEIIENSTAKKLERLAAEEADLRESLQSIERVESRAKNSIPPSAEENDLWTEIRRLSDEEASILRQKMVPERYVRPDALEHFSGELKRRREELEASSSGLKYNQTHGPRVVAKFEELQRDEHSFTTAIKPVCIAGQRLFQIREKKQELSARRDALKTEREAKALATI